MTRDEILALKDDELYRQAYVHILPVIYGPVRPETLAVDVGNWTWAGGWANAGNVIRAMQIRGFDFELRARSDGNASAEFFRKHGDPVVGLEGDSMEARVFSEVPDLILRVALLALLDVGGIT